jgi:RNA polymerase sigma-70 factor (ECF subfamily)
MTEATALAGSAMAQPDDPSARLGRLFDTHQARLYRLARRMCRSADDARDLIQDTFVRAAQNPGKVPVGQPNEEAWLVRVMINLCRDRWRQQASRARHDASVGGMHPLPAADPEAACVARSVIWQALDALPPRRRAVVVMYELEGVSVPVIAATLGVAQVTVRWHLARGRQDMALTIGELR